MTRNNPGNWPEFGDALAALVATGDPAQVVYGWLALKGWSGWQSTRHLVVPGVGIEEVEVFEFSLESARKAVDSLVRLRQLKEDESSQIGNQPISIGFNVDDTLPSGVLDPYTDEEYDDRPQN